jgi:hypothetical protein
VVLVFGLLRGKHGIPDRGRSLTFELQSIQGKLIFVDTPPLPGSGVLV